MAIHPCSALILPRAIIPPDHPSFSSPMVSFIPRPSCTIIALTRSVGSSAWKTFLPMATPAPPASIESWAIYRISSVVPIFGSPVTTTGMGQPPVTSLNESMSPVWPVLTMSSSISAAAPAAILTYSKEVSGRSSRLADTSSQAGASPTPCGCSPPVRAGSASLALSRRRC